MIKNASTEYQVELSHEGWHLLPIIQGFKIILKELCVTKMILFLLDLTSKQTVQKAPEVLNCPTAARTRAEIFYH
jgi:hypothetical protein